jgi:hypothetical protein
MAMFHFQKSSRIHLRKQRSPLCPPEIALTHIIVWFFLLFQKRSKSVSSASRKAMGYPTLGEADPGGLGACPQQNSTLRHFLLFHKRSKSVSSASRKAMGDPTLGEADPGSLGACPQQNSTLSHFLLFQKRSKSVSSASQKSMGCPTFGEADPGGLGACPQKMSAVIITCANYIYG